jgi:hypothetical protein
MSRTTVIFIKLVLSLMLIDLLVGCGYFSRGPGDQDKWDETGLSMEREVTPSITLCKGEAREVLKKFCGKCHQKSISIRPGALRIYNLEDDIWYKNLSKSNLKGIKRRIRNWDGPTDEEVNKVLGCVACLESETCR